METLSDILETMETKQLASGFVFTEGPTWHPKGFYYFVDIRTSKLYRIVPGDKPELVRENTGGGNGTTFDLKGRLLMCEGDNRRVTRMDEDNRAEPIAEMFEGKRLNRPNDIICKSDGSIYFTDPGIKLLLQSRELPYSGVYRILPKGDIKLIAKCEYPNGLAFSPDEHVLYVANSRWTQYILAIELSPEGFMLRQSIFADMSSDGTEGVPDGIKVDAQGHVYCAGPGGTWVFAPSGTRLGIISTPEIPSNLNFGGSDLRTLFITARTSVYTLRIKIPGNPHPWYTKQ